MKPSQTTMGERVTAFDHDVATSRRGRTLIETVCDAMVRRYGTLEDAADALNRAFEPDGRPVTGALLRAAAKQKERNCFRAERVALVADDPEVRAFFNPPVVDWRAECHEMREHFARRASGELESFDRMRGRRG